DTNTGALSFDGSQGVEIQANVDIGGLFTVEGLDIAYQQHPDGTVDFSASGMVGFPRGYQVGLTELKIHNSQLQAIGLHLAGSIAIGDTGVFLNSFDGSLEGLDNVNTISVSASASLSFGKEVEVLGTKYSLVSVSGTISVNANHLYLAGDREIPGGILGDGSATVDINWSTGVSSINITHIGLYDDTFNFMGSLIVTNQGDVTLQASATVNVPKDLPFIGGLQLAGVGFYLQIRPNEDL